MPTKRFYLHNVRMDRPKYLLEEKHVFGWLCMPMNQLANPLPLFRRERERGLRVWPILITIPSMAWLQLPHHLSSFVSEMHQRKTTFYRGITCNISTNTSRMFVSSDSFPPVPSFCCRLVSFLILYVLSLHCS